MDFDVPAEHRVGIKNRQILGFFQRAKKSEEHDGDGDTNCSWNGPQGLRDQRKNQDHQTTALSRSARIHRRVLGT